MRDLRPFFAPRSVAVVGAGERATSSGGAVLKNLGASGFRLFRRIVFPLAMPGYLAGAALVFLKVFDDVGTPLVLNVTNILAAQAYLRITSIGIDDPMGYVIAVVLILIAVVTMWASAQVLKGKDYATVQRGGGGLARRRLNGRQAVLAYAVVLLILALVLAPHVGLLLLSFATVWSFSPLPDGYTFAHYARVLGDSSTYITNTLLYSGLAAAIDVVLGGAIAYLVLRTRLPGRTLLDWGAGAALAVPGVVLGIGYLRAFYGVRLPDGTPLAALALGLIVFPIDFVLKMAGSSGAGLVGWYVGIADAAFAPTALPTWLPRLAVLVLPDGFGGRLVGVMRVAPERVDEDAH